MGPGRFVTLEGPEGAGKSTLARSLAEALREAGVPCVQTREPGATPLGSQIRRLLLEGEGMSPRAELHLFLADRAEHVATLVRPALERGEWVVCDRYSDSTIVYQSAARGLDEAEVRRGCDEATAGLWPDLTLLLDLPPEVGLARATKGDRLDREPLAFHTQVRKGFLRRAEEEPERFRVLDATASPEAVMEAAWVHVITFRERFA